MTIHHRARLIHLCAGVGFRGLGNGEGPVYMNTYNAIGSPRFTVEEFRRHMHFRWCTDADRRKGIVLKIKNLLKIQGRNFNGGNVENRVNRVLGYLVRSKTE